MPLNWNAESVKDWDDLPEYKLDVIHWTMHVGISQIKKDNVDNWCDRAQFLRMNNGAWMRALRENGEEFYPFEDREFMTKMVGLRTNASNVPQNKWLRQLFESNVSDWAWCRRDDNENS